MEAKKALSLASLVAAVPAAVLTYFLVAAVLGHSENIAGMMWGIIILTFFGCAGLVVMPVAAMVLGGRKPSSSAVAVADAPVVVTTDKKKSKEQLEDEPEATFISDATIELDEDAMSADEDLDDFETFDDLDDNRK